MDRKTFIRMLTFAAVLVAVYFSAQLIVSLSHVWILVFGSIVVAVVIRAIADPLSRWIRWPDGLSVLTAVLAILGVLGLAGFLFGQQVAVQVDQLVERLPGAWAAVQARIESSPAARQLLEQAQSLGSSAGGVLARAPMFVAGAFSSLGTLFLVMVAGIFLAVRPGEARDGVLSLLPFSARDRGREVLNTCGRALKGWLKAQVLSMVLVGSLVGVGLSLIGVPSPLALGLFTGLAQFVPIIGPIAAAVPALLISATAGMQTLVLTLILYVGVSQLESNLITPLVQKNVAALPVVLGVFAVVAFAILFGPVGVLFATPLALVLYTAVTMLYRRDVLGDMEATVPGERRAKD